MDRKLKRVKKNEKQKCGMILALRGVKRRLMPFIALQQAGPSCDVAVTLLTSIRQLDVEEKESSNRGKEYHRIRTCITRLPAMLLEPRKGFHTGKIDHYAKTPPRKEL